MRLFLFAAAVVVMSLPVSASAARRYSNSRVYRYQSPSYSSNYSYGSNYSYSTPSSNRFLYRGYNPGHVFGNSVRRLYWGASMGPR